MKIAVAYFAGILSVFGATFLGLLGLGVWVSKNEDEAHDKIAKWFNKDYGKPRRSYS